MTKAIHNVLVATDFGEPAHEAVELARAMAERFGAGLTLLHVCPVPAIAYGDTIEWPIPKLQEAAQKALGGAVLRIRHTGGNVEPVLETGIPWERILAVAESRHADLIVVGTHGRRGISRLVLGSVAEKVVRLSPVPVITVPAPRE